MTILLVSESFAKSHVKGYTKADGTVVKPHEDKRSARRVTAHSARTPESKAVFDARNSGDWDAYLGLVAESTGMAHGLERFLQQEGNTVDMIAWHGTAAEHLPSILKNGILPQVEGEMVNRSRKSDFGKTFVSADKRDARTFASYALGRLKDEHPDAKEASAVLLVIRIPAQERSRVEWDENGTETFGNAVGGVPPEWIVGYQTLTATQDDDVFSPSKTVYTKLHKAESKDHYAVLIFSPRRNPLSKSHNSGYTKKDGTVVNAFDDKRYAKPAGKWSSGAVSSGGKFKAPQYGASNPPKPSSWGGHGGSSGSLFSGGPKPEPKAYHPKLGDKGQKVGIYSPHIPSVAALSDPGAIATITPGCEMPESLNGIPFAPWTPPAEDQWDYVDGQKDDLVEPDLHCPAGKEPASGLVIVETDGRVWLVSPTNKFGGYMNTFPKGKVEPELSFQANAIKEAWEEGGIKANIVGLLGDVERTTSVTRYYLARRVAGNPAADVTWESQAVHLCPISKLTGFLDAKVDHQVVGLMAG